MHMKNARSLVFAALAVIVLAAPIGALTLKVGSLVPSGSPWDNALRRIAAEWTRLSGGSVSMKIYAAGVAGDEPDLVRKMRIGQIDAAMITMSGLQGIYNGIKVLSYPLFVKDDAELEYVLGKMEPFFEDELEKRGFKVILWSEGGWLYFFSRYPIVTPDDLRKQKLWVWGSPEEVQAWQRSAFQVVPLASTNVTTSLQSGMIDAVISSPLVTASSQWFGTASHMTDLKLAPLWGAAVVSLKTWAQVPADLQPRLIQAARAITRELSPQIARGDSEAIAVMEKYGLRLTNVDQKAREQWAKEVRNGFSMLIGTVFNRQSYDMVEEYIEEFRSSHGGG
jgi:TRAP-type C4-dicarboxylate transport system substrate-binding protein